MQLIIADPTIFYKDLKFSLVHKNMKTTALQSSTLYGPLFKLNQHKN